MWYNTTFNPLGYLNLFAEQTMDEEEENDQLNKIKNIFQNLISFILFLYEYFYWIVIGMLLISVIIKLKQTFNALKMIFYFLLLLLKIFFYILKFIILFLKNIVKNFFCFNICMLKTFFKSMHVKKLNFLNLKKSIKKKRENYSKNSIEILNKWLAENKDIPYANKEEKNRLSLECNLTVQQVTFWMSNQRKKLKKNDFN